MAAVHTDTSSGPVQVTVNFTRTSSFCAGRVFIQFVRSKEHKFILI